jgi:GNAT superfamily N-acetyltransferase
MFEEREGMIRGQAGLSERRPARHPGAMGRPPLESLSIRAGEAADLLDLRAVFRRASLSNAGDAAAMTAHPDVLIWPADALDAGRVRVATAEGVLVGFASARRVDDTFELDDLFVDPDWMGRGIGRRLVLDAAGLARAVGVDRIDVDANPHALDFYRRVGFERDGEVKTQFGTAIRMHLPCAP